MCELSCLPLLQAHVATATAVNLTKANLFWLLCCCFTIFMVERVEEEEEEEGSDLPQPPRTLSRCGLKVLLSLMICHQNFLLSFLPWGRQRKKWSRNKCRNHVMPKKKGVAFRTFTFPVFFFFTFFSCQSQISSWPNLFLWQKKKRKEKETFPVPDGTFQLTQPRNKLSHYPTNIGAHLWRRH